MQPTHRLSLLSLLALVMLAGCEAPLPTKPTPAMPSVIQQTDLARALELVTMEEYAAAAALYRDLATQAFPPLRQDLQLRAAENYLLANEPEAARQLLTQVGDGLLPPLLSLRRRLLTADLALGEGRFLDALSLLEAAPPKETPPELWQRYHRQRAETFRLAGNLLESARELAELDLLISDPETRLNTQQAIIQTLSSLTNHALEMLQPDPPGIQGGWMELARIIKGYAGEPERTRTLLNAWRQHFPDHPALPALLEGYMLRLQAQYRAPTHLAVLLPLSGHLADAATALRNGLMAAYYQLPPARRPRLHFYDSSNPADTWPLYRQAVDAGADVIIGPLSKEAVSQLARAGMLEIPVLALNQVPPQVTPPENLFQFGLAPEDEARQVAERAWLDGHSGALVLTPQGDWGERIYSSFRERWESLDGTLLEQQRYNPRKQGLSRSILALLDIDRSRQRRRELERILKQKVHFEPRRRQDADFIFFAARPDTARQIRPLLQFHYAADLPVYTTSHAYAGTPDPKKDRDLEGLKFPDIPWLLMAEETSPLSRSALTAIFPDIQLRYQRLYAMGIDGFNLLPHLLRLQTSPWETLDGQTGNLYLDDINQVHRRLVWAQIRKGVPDVIGYAPRIESDLITPGEGLPPAPAAPLPGLPETGTPSP